MNYMGSSATYSYDGNGLRVKKVSGSTTTVYIFSGSKVIAEYDNSAAPGSPSREYIYSGSVLLAKIEAGATTYFHSDHLSNRVLSDSAGNVLGQRGHYPFGETWYEAGTTTKIKFTTYERDSESTNDYAMARTYINRFGRFSSADPLAGVLADPQSLNRYTYVLNDPCSLTDPLGADPQGPCSFNIGLYGTGLLSKGQLQALQSALAGIFATPGVGVNFNFSGPADFSLSIVPSGTPVGYDLNGPVYPPPTAIGSDPATSKGAFNHGLLFFDRPTSFYGISSTSSALVGSILGRAGAHEAGHYLLNMLHNDEALSGYGGIMDAHPNLLDPHLGFTGGQKIQLQYRCKKLHPASGGGNSGGGDGSNGSGPTVWWFFTTTCGESGCYTEYLGGIVFWPTPNNRPKL